MLIRTTIMTIMIVSLHLNTMGIIISISIIIATINIIGVLIISIRTTWAVGLVELVNPRGTAVRIQCGMGPPSVTCAFFNIKTTQGQHISHLLFFSVSSCRVSSQKT